MSPESIARQFLEHNYFFTTMLDEVPVGIALLGMDNRVVLTNRAYESITGVDRQQALRMSCIHALRCDFCMKNCPVLAGEQNFTPISTPADIINRDREKVPVQLSISPLVNEQGINVGFLETVQDMRVVSELSRQADRAYKLGALVGKSPQIEKVFRMIPSVAQTDSSVLITGETGTGKDMLAESIHKSSDRASGPFIKVNCGALPDTLLESELFGHTKGAFTGADKNKPGRFRLAHGGTLFLTEIGDLPLPLQVKLLSFLDDKIIYPLGSTSGVSVDVRIIVATHRNLKEMVAQKAFRQDLLFRLNVVRMHLPPLRDRGEDLALLKGHFLQKFKRKFQKDIKGFSDGTRDCLQSYAYPGNVRELRNIVEYAVNFCDQEYIQKHHLPAYLTERAPEDGAGPDLLDLGGDQARIPEARPARASSWADAERQMILNALVRAGGRKSLAAEILGWGRSTLWRKMKKHDITG